MKKGNAKKLGLNKIQVTRLTDLHSIKGGLGLDDEYTVLSMCPNGGNDKPKDKDKPKVDFINAAY